MPDDAPEQPTPETPATLPVQISLWLRDPAKIAFRIVSAAMVVAATVASLLVQHAGLVPEKYQATANAVLAACTAIGVGGAKVVAWLIAHGYGPAANGKNGAWSPLANYEAVQHAQTMSLRRGASDGTALPGAPSA